MIHNSGTYISHDSIKIFFQLWKPETEIKKVICLIHGIGEHTGRYNAWATKFTEAGYAFFAFDLRGHGRSEGKRGDAKNYELFMLDIQQAFKEIDTIFPGLPVIPYGHSLGGTLVLSYLLQKQPKISAAIVTAPWLKLAFKVPYFKIVLGKLVHEIFPGLTQPNGLHIEDLTRSNELFEPLRNDPLVHNKISVRLYFATSCAGIWALENSSKLKIPLLLMHGDRDRITSHKASSYFAENTKNHTTFKLWKGYYHELHNEPENNDVASYIINWVNENFRN